MTEVHTHCPIEEAFMDAVWSALKADANDLRKQQRILRAFRAARTALADPPMTPHDRANFEASMQASAAHEQSPTKGSATDVVVMVDTITTAFGTCPLDDLPADLVTRWRTVRIRKDGMPDKRYLLARDLWHETEQWAMRKYMENK